MIPEGSVLNEKTEFDKTVLHILNYAVLGPDHEYHHKNDCSTLSAIFSEIKSDDFFFRFDLYCFLHKKMNMKTVCISTPYDFYTKCCSFT